MENILIVPFKEQHKKRFKELNYEWIKSYFEVTELDRVAYNNPQEEIINKGGYIFIALSNKKVVGSVSLEKSTNSEYVLARMGVEIGCQGLQIGQKLVEVALQKALDLNLKSIILYTNHKLVKALNLYTKNGFKFSELDKVGYRRATIKMIKNL